MLQYKSDKDVDALDYGQSLWKPEQNDYVFVAAGTSVDGTPALGYDTLKLSGSVDVYKRTQDAGVGLDVSSIVKRLSEGTLYVKSPSADQYDPEDVAKEATNDVPKVVDEVKVVDKVVSDVSSVKVAEPEGGEGKEEGK